MRAEVYEDNAGFLHVFAVDGGEPVWGIAWTDETDMESKAAADVYGISVQGLDPVHEGWDGFTLEELREDYDGWLGLPIVETDECDNVILHPDRMGVEGLRLALEFVERDFSLMRFFR